MVHVSELIEKVRKGGFIFISESSLVEYTIQDDCSLEQIGEVFNAINYGLVFKPGAHFAMYSNKRRRNIFFYHFILCQSWDCVNPRCKSVYRDGQSFREITKYIKTIQPFSKRWCCSEKLTKDWRTKWIIQRKKKTSVFLNEQEKQKWTI